MGILPSFSTRLLTQGQGRRRPYTLTFRVVVVTLQLATTALGSPLAPPQSPRTFCFWAEPSPPFPRL